MATISGGIKIRNAKTGVEGTLGIIVLNNSNELVGLTNHHVLYYGSGALGDPVEAFIAGTNAYVSIGNVGKANKEYDAALIQIDTSTHDFKAYYVQDYEMAKLDSRKVKKGETLYKFGAGTNQWNKAKVLGYNKNIIDLSGKPIVSDRGDSGAVWVAGPQPYTVYGLHFWGSDDAKGALAKNINKVAKVMGLKTRA